MLRRTSPAHKYFFSFLILVIGGASLFWVRQSSVESNRFPAQANAPAGDVTGDSNLPRLGRSIFDHLNFDEKEGLPPFPISRLAKRIVAAGIYDSAVQSRFSAGAQEINELLSPLALAFFPSGRSPFRLAAGRELFKFPRVIIGQPAGAKSIADRIYVAYSEAYQQLEVISFNEAMGRFEFQIVHQYAEGKTPLVRYADRAFCFSCHQNQGPIFPVFPWSDSNANFEISRFIDSENGSHQRYQGLSLRNTLQSLDDSIFRASLILEVQDAWQTACGKVNDDPARQCRATLVLEALLKQVFPSHEVFLAKGLRAEIESNRGLIRKRHADAGAPKLPLRNPRLKDRSVPSFGKNAEDIEWATDYFLNRAVSLSLEENPSVLRREERLSGIGDRTEQNFLVSQMSAHMWEKVEFAQEFRKELKKTGISAVWSRVREVLASQPEVFDAGSFKPCRTLQAIYPEWTERYQGKARCFEADAPGMIAPAAVEASAVTVFQDPRLSRLQIYCSKCHASDDQESLAFLSGESEAVVCEKIKRWASSIEERLSSEAEKGRMPPPKSEQGKHMNAHPDIREQLIQDVRAIRQNSCVTR